jgi:hypothetical protein
LVRLLGMLLGILHWKGGLGERGSAVSAFLFSPVFSQQGRHAALIRDRLRLIVGNFFGCGLGTIFLERLRNHWGRFYWSPRMCIKLFCSCGKWEKWSVLCVCSCFFCLSCYCFPLAFWVNGRVVYPLSVDPVGC